MTRRGIHLLSIRSRGVALAALLLLAAATMPAAANATFLNAHWPYTAGTWLHIQYGNCVGVAGWRDRIDEAANSWTATLTPFYVDPGTCAMFGSGSPVNAYAGSLKSGALCSTSWWRTTGTDVMTRADVWENADTDSFGRYTRFGALDLHGQRSCVGHEFGHALGFGHAGQYGIDGGVYSGPISPTIMDYCCTYDVPQVYDVCQANLLYPGKFGCFS